MPDGHSAKEKLLVYSDVSKLMSTLDSPDCEVLTQSELDKLVKWANTWLIELKLDKCKVMHFGNHSPAPMLTMLNTVTDERVPLALSSCERDLGIQVSNDPKWKTQCAHAASRSNRVLGMLNRTFVSKDVVLWKLLYTSLV